MTKYRQYHLKVQPSGDEMAELALRASFPELRGVQQSSWSDGEVESLARAREIARAVAEVFPHVRLDIVSYNPQGSVERVTV